ncbi:methyl-accepting chemotaxis protein [Jannaschia pohangensis]|nr:HAMP domain-containing methyl-accepting chemotaxis protein [Jannaschia pohangensis]
MIGAATEAPTRWWQSLVGQTTILILVLVTVSASLVSIINLQALNTAVRKDYEEMVSLVASSFARQIEGPIRAFGPQAAEPIARDAFALPGSKMRGVRAYFPDTDKAITAARPEFEESLAGLRPATELVTEMQYEFIGDYKRVLVPLYSANGAQGSVIGVLEIYFDPTEMEERLHEGAVRTFLTLAIVVAVLSVLSFVLLRRQIAVPLRQAIDAMESLAKDDADTVLPKGRTTEIKSISSALRAFRSNIVERKLASENNALAEQRNAELVRKQEEATREAQEAQAARAQRAAEEAQARIEMQTLLQRDIEALIAAATDGDFSARMKIEDIPEDQVALRKMINGLLSRIGEGVDDVVEVLSQLEQGVLSARMEGVRSGAFATLQSSANATASHLERALGDLSRHAAGVLDDSSDLSASAEDLSKRTERTAGSLAETTAALDQIVESISSTATLTAQVRKSADQAQEEARESDVIVKDAATAMNAIQAVSKEITQTLTVINDIAFQTNLLALNAGVEAARAGESGRGFAVVASEVRALAQRASDASQLIGDLIEKSSDEIERGVQRVARTGETLSSLGESILLISSQVTEIAQATDAQSSAAAEINRAMGEIDGATQQNTAMFEEITTANLSLKGAASQMLKLIERFDLADRDSVHAAWQGHSDDNKWSAGASPPIAGTAMAG